MRVILERKEQARECAFTTYAPESVGVMGC